MQRSIVTQRQPEGAGLSKNQQIARPGVSAEDGVWGAIFLLKISVQLEGGEMHCSDTVLYHSNRL